MFVKQGPYTTGGPGTAANANNWETQYDEAVKSFQADLLTAFVYTGFVATKDGTIASQLNVTAGTAYVSQTDNTRRNRTIGSSNQSTSGHPSTTMWLFLNPDGTWAWQTSSTPPAGALSIAHCTTDGSSNILVVTDDRVTSTTFLNGMVGALDLPPLTGGLSLTGLFTFANALSAANQLFDWEQGFGLWSDNAGGTFGGSTSRLWFASTNALGTQEMQFGPRGGALPLAGVRFNTANVIFNPMAGTPGTFSILGGITTTMTGVLTIQAGTTATPDLLYLTNPTTPAYRTIIGMADAGGPGGGGWYAYDSINAGFIFQQGRASGINFMGVVKSNNGSPVAIQGAHSAGQPIISYGSGAPGSLSANEIYIQLT
jgi:hypothetical protein